MAGEKKPELTPQQEERQRQIRAEKETIDDEISDAEAARSIAIAKLNALQRKCKHPRAYMAVIGGENTKYCPDCEWQR